MTRLDFSSSAEAGDDEHERLRRHLRALSAVNRQLHAQVEGGALRPVAAASRDDLLGGGSDGAGNRLAMLALRRGAAGSEWIEQLQLLGSAAEPFLARCPSRGSYLIEGRLRRQIKAGILIAALERMIGDSREMSQADLDHYTDGPPVEVLEGPTGPAFVIVAGRRLPLRGLPLPYPVTLEEMLRFPEGQELRIVGRRTRSARVRSLMSREGALGAGAAVVKRGSRRVLKSARPVRGDKK